MIEKLQNGILLINEKNFSPKQTLECGQVFRYVEKDGVYKVFSQDKYAEISLCNKDTYLISTVDVDYFYNYFDLDTDYSVIADKVASFSPVLSNAVQFGSGIRILKQSFIETLFSFIISANNNIKRIQLIIERMCTALGRDTPYGKAFPVLSALASVDANFYRSIGAGYRDVSLYKTAQILNCELGARYNEQAFATLTTSQLCKKLCDLPGIGEKVANCVMLFSLSRTDTFPVDTWIKKVYHAYFEAGHNDKDIKNYLISLFGEYSGYVQQYLFYYQRGKF